MRKERTSEVAVRGKRSNEGEEEDRGKNTRTEGALEDMGLKIGNRGGAELAKCI